MSKDGVSEIKWLPDVEEHDYPAAASFLGLIFNDEYVKFIINNLKTAPITEFHVKDVIRASGLAPLPLTNFHVNKDLKKINDGKSLSPILLVRDEANGKVTIADGWHRVCAIYLTNEDALVHVKIV